MASISKHTRGYRAQVARGGVRKSKVFPTKQQAKDWAAREEHQILNADLIAADMTFGALMDRYARERSGAKRGARWEIIRLEKLGRDKIAKIKLGALKASDFADWRDRRTSEVAPGSVIREMQLMTSVLSVARKEWGLIGENPMRDVRKPTKPPPRDRLPGDEEIERLRHTAGSDLTKATARAFHAFLFAMETAMRAGEVCNLQQADLNLEGRVARLTRTKNGHPRDVPLSSEAVRLIEALPHGNPVFGLSSRSLDVLWRKVRDRAQVEDLTFHNSRHAAVTRLAGKLDVLALAKMVGHRDLRQLQAYYSETASEIAKRLD